MNKRLGIGGNGLRVEEIGRPRMRLPNYNPSSILLREPVSLF